MYTHTHTHTEPHVHTHTHTDILRVQTCNDQYGAGRGDHFDNDDNIGDDHGVETR